MEQLNIINLKEVHEWENRNVFPLKVYYDEETRTRVFCGQLQNEFILNINKHNYLYHISLYFKYGSRLLKKFPNSQLEIDNAAINFWQRVQMKLKEHNTKQ